MKKYSYTSGGQYYAVKKFIAERLPPQCIRDERLHVQDSIPLLKNHCGKATRTVHQGRGFTGSGQYSAVEKKIIAARLPGQCIRDEGLQVQDSILLLKKKSLRQGYQDSASGTRVYKFSNSILL